MKTDVISTTEAAEILGVTTRRVLALIESGRLPAIRMRRFYVLRREDLALVADRKTGRPPKTAKKTAAKKAKKGAK